MKKLTTKDSQMVQSTQKWMKKNLLSFKFSCKDISINCRSYNIYDSFAIVHSNLKFVRKHTSSDIYTGNLL